MSGTVRKGEGGIRTKAIFKKSLPEKPLLTIITAAFNEERNIEQTIASVINQEYKNVEYIIIDGGSTDGTLDVIKKYENQLDYWVSETDGGLYDAINKGIKFAKGDFIATLNAGDFYFKDSLLQVVQAMNNNNSENIFHGDLLMVSEFITHCSYVKKTPEIEKMLYKQSVFHPTCFVKKTIYDRLGLYNTQYKIAADYDFLLRCLKNNIQFSYVPKTITAYRSGGMSASYECDFECYTILRKNNIPNPNKYIYRGIKSYLKQLIKKKIAS